MYSQMVRRVVKVAQWCGRVAALCSDDLQHSHAAHAAVMKVMA